MTLLRPREIVALNESGAVLLPQHDILPDALGVDKSEVSLLIVLGLLLFRRQGDTESGRHDDVRPACDVPGWQVAEEVFKSNRLGSLERLWLKHDGVLIVTVDTCVVNLHALIQSLELVGFKVDLNKCIFLLALVEALLFTFDRWCNVRVLLVEVLLLA